MAKLKASASEIMFAKLWWNTKDYFRQTALLVQYGFPLYRIRSISAILTVYRAERGE